MKHSFYKLLLLFAQSLRWLKRSFSHLSEKTKPFFDKVGLVYRDTLGFWLYRFLFGVKRKALKLHKPLGGWFFHFFGKRAILQIVLFVAGVAIMLPQTSLYSKDVTSIPGRNTVLYEIVGRGEQDFDYQEVFLDVSSIQNVDDSRSWREAAVILESGGTPIDIILEQEGLGGISGGGTAVAKPTISPGAEVPTINSGASKRTEVIVYEVKPGDVISTIAQKFDLSVLTILWANKLTSRSYIRPGDTLKILPVDGVLHTVIKGDTLTKIASKYKAKASDIIEFNKLQEDGSDLVIGENLIVPNGVQPQSSVSSPTQQTVFRQVAAPPPSINSPAGSEFIWPTTVRRITQYFGLLHTGLDIAGPIGTPLYASKGGTVIKSQCGWNGGYGCYVIIDHGGGVTTLYGHASKLYVSKGDAVEQGQTIALMGSTGRSTGPHIHFEVRVNGARQNPLRYVR